MAKQTVNIGSTANDGTGDQLRNAFDKLNQNNEEIYGPNFVTELMLNDNIVGADKLKVTGDGAAGQILTSNADGTFSWTTGVAGDITGVEAGDGLTGGGTGGNVTLNVGAGTGITVANDTVSLAASVQSEISENTLKNTDQTVVLNQGANVTITGTYPEFTIASDDVVGAVTSVNTAVGAVVLDTDDVAQGTTNLYNVTHTGDVEGSGQLTIKDDVVTAAKLDVSNTGADGQILQYNADGTMTWVTGVTGDITSVATGDGLTGGDTSGDVTISLDATVAGDGLTLSSGVLSVDTIQTGDVADDAITSPKLAEFDDTFTAGTSGDIIVSNGTDFIHATMSGDATIVAGGAITIADDAVDADKLADSINTDIAAGVAKVSFPGFGTTAGTSLEGDTDLLQLGTSDTTALAGDTETITTDQASKIAANHLKVSNVTHSGDVTDASGVLTLVADKVITSTILDANVTTAKIADDAVDYDKLGTEFTTSTGLTEATNLDVDWSTAAIFTIPSAAPMDLNFTSAEIGQVKTIIVTDSGGTSALTFDNSMTITTLNGSYSATAGAVNYIQAVCTAANTFFLTISQAA